MKFKVVELFSGIGSQTKALKNIGANFETVAIADWDIFAIISYAAVHHNDELLSSMKEFDKLTKVEKNERREELISELSQKTLSRDSKVPIKSLKGFQTKFLNSLSLSLSLSL